MGLFSRATKGYVGYFKRSAGYLLNADGLKRGGQMAGQAWRRSRHKECPKCSGLLVPIIYQDDPAGRIYLQCEKSDCDYVQPKELFENGGDDGEAAAMKKQLEDIKNSYSADELENIQSNHVLMARSFYAVGVITLAFSIYQLFTDRPFTSIVSLMFCVSFCAQAFKHSYYLWKIKENRFYDKRSLRDFIHHGRWVV